MPTVSTGNEINIVCSRKVKNESTSKKSQALKTDNVGQELNSGLKYLIIATDRASYQNISDGDRQI